MSSINAKLFHQAFFVKDILCSAESLLCFKQDGSLRWICIFFLMQIRNRFLQSCWTLISKISWCRTVQQVACTSFHQTFGHQALCTWNTENKILFTSVRSINKLGFGCIKKSSLYSIRYQLRLPQKYFLRNFIYSLRLQSLTMCRGPFDISTYLFYVSVLRALATKKRLSSLHSEVYSQ
jgi:hypothetical protein